MTNMLVPLLRRMRLPRPSKGLCGAVYNKGRCFSLECSDYLSVTTDPEFGGSVAVVTLKKKPVNSLCSNHLRAITNTIVKLEEDENMRAMIITSAFPGLFCAGLDIMSMYKRTADEINEYWIDLQDMVITNYSTRLITIAAMNGHCLTGGCTLPLAVDYRIIAENHLIGLNEAYLGLRIPFFVESLTKNIIGMRQSERILQLGLLMKSHEALDIGFVDEVVPMDRVMTAAREQVARWLQVPDSSRTAVKENIRREFIEEFHDRRSADLQYYTKLISGPLIQTFFKKNIGKMKENKKVN